jgi:hypothetical protein
MEEVMLEGVHHRTTAQIRDKMKTTTRRKTKR